MDTKISISIVVYKNYKDTAEAIDSIERNTSDKVKKIIYVIDNSQSDINSSDRNEFESHLKKYSDVVYIDTGENLGFGKGHNYVLNDLQSEYHAIVNPDTLIIRQRLNIPMWLRSMALAMKKSLKRYTTSK